MNIVANPHVVADRHKDVEADRRNQIISHLQGTPSRQLPEVLRSFEINGAPAAELDLVRDLINAPRPPAQPKKPARLKAPTAAKGE